MYPPVYCKVRNNHNNKIIVHILILKTVSNYQVKFNLNKHNHFANIDIANTEQQQVLQVFFMTDVLTFI